MRKRIGALPSTKRDDSDRHAWLDLESLAAVEVSSEDPSFPIESALAPQDGPGWRASHSGDQQIRIVFDEPQAVHRIRLQFHETDAERTQEFTLRWVPASGGAAREIVRQQWNFSPGASPSETESYAVNLDGVAALELAIRPDIGGREVLASLASWRVG